MKIDFSKLAQSKVQPRLLAPREIFSVLQRDSRYQYPRDVQSEVWDSWFARRAEPDVVVKMNTGSGKTVVGLVMLQSCLNESIGPAVYVTADSYLRQQVIAEAGRLGIEATDDPSNTRFRRGDAILVANIHKLVNGRSVFGIASEGVRIPIGSLIVDDAHACLESIESQFTIRLGAKTALYKQIFKLFREDLRAQSPTGLLDLEADDPNRDMLVPFWAWQDKQTAISTLLHTHRETPELMWQWPLVKEVLPLCTCVIGGGVLEIAPRCIPIDVIPSIASARRKIFMTATLADDSVLITHFDAKQAGPAVTPGHAADVGDRLILVPQELNASLGDDKLREWVKKVSRTINVVVVVPSRKRGSLWSSIADQSLEAKDFEAGIDRLRKGHVGLTVILNKYDGIDLPDDACRLLVLDGLPDVRSGLERIEQAVLYGSTAHASALAARIEQGMGRGVRSSADYCVVVLMGRNLVERLVDTSVRTNFSATTRAQLALSEALAVQLDGATLDNLSEVVQRVLVSSPYRDHVIG